jgi:hypothetical protein
MRRVLAVAASGAVALAFLAGAWSCRPAASPGAGQEAGEEPERYPADLGPDEVDVTSYPRAQQEGYALFVARCSGCHPPARTINSPIKDSATWTRYVTRMHVKSETLTGKPLLSDTEARRIIGFLVFDSRERKLKRADQFEAQQRALTARFKAEEAARVR